MYFLILPVVWFPISQTRQPRWPIAQARVGLNRLFWTRISAVKSATVASGFAIKVDAHATSICLPIVSPFLAGGEHCVGEWMHWSIGVWKRSVAVTERRRSYIAQVADMKFALRQLIYSARGGFVYGKTADSPDQKSHGAVVRRSWISSCNGRRCWLACCCALICR